MRASDLNPDIHRAAGCLIHARDTNNWLFVLRGEYVDNPHTWGIPGGRGSAREDYVTTAIRETLEEINYDVADCPMKMIYALKTEWPMSIYKVYAVQVEKQFKPILDWESAEYKWCGLDDLPTPLHWGLDAMLNSDKSAEILHEWLESLV